MIDTIGRILLVRHGMRAVGEWISEHYEPSQYDQQREAAARAAVEQDLRQQMDEMSGCYTSSDEDTSDYY